jgi:uncharacterized membrane protein
MWAGGWGFWWIFPLLMMVVMGVCLFMMVRMWSGHGRSEPGRSSALRILGERFANGEISKEEFEEKRAILGGRP